MDQSEQPQQHRAEHGGGDKPRYLPDEGRDRAGDAQHAQEYPTAAEADDRHQGHDTAADARQQGQPGAVEVVFGAGESAAGRLFGRRQLKDVDPIILAWLQKHIPLPVLLALVLGLIMALLGVWLAARYRAWSHEEDEERSSVWSWRLFWSQIRQALRGMRGALRGRSGMSTAPRPEPEPVVSSIRQLYSAVLRWCGERRRPRAPADTPLEYEPALDEELGNKLGRDLTDAYVLARYAEEDADPEVVRSLRERWEAYCHSELREESVTGADASLGSA